MLTHLVDFAWTAHAPNTSQLSNSKVHNALLSITQISHLSQDTIIFSFLLNKFFWPSGVGFPISTLRFIYIIMFMQRIRIIGEDAGFKPGTSALPEV